jgi:hypothetical protein
MRLLADQRDDAVIAIFSKGERRSPATLSRADNDHTRLHAIIRSSDLSCRYRV